VVAKGPRSWREKLENPGEGLPKVVTGPPKWERRIGGRRVFVATPLLVNGVIQKVWQGKLITLGQIREHLAKDFQADAACPLTTGIFVRIVSEVAEEDLRADKEKVTSCWRVIREDGSLNKKFPGGAVAQAARLREEGYTIEETKGNKVRVKDFERALLEL
jgi:alkylated DNA nucleotide flippase Atl1